MNVSIGCKYWQCGKLDFDPGEWPRYPSQPKMETGIPQAYVHWIAKFDLGLTPFKITNLQRLTRKDEKKQTESGRRLLLYTTLANLEKTFFTNEKIFKLEAPNNKQSFKRSQRMDRWRMGGSTARCYFQSNQLV